MSADNKINEQDSTLKRGARNAASDQKHLNAAHKSAKDVIDHLVQAGALEEEDAPTVKAGELKIDDLPVLDSVFDVKAGDDMSLDVRIAWGKDSHGESFTPATDFDLENYATPPAAYYHGYTDANRPAPRPIFIGKTVKRYNAEDGHHIIVKLNGNQYARATYEAAVKGQAVASPATAAHLIRKGAGGHLDYWPVVEISAWPITNGHKPANMNSIATPYLKALYSEAGIELPTSLVNDAEQDQEAEAQGAVSAADADQSAGVTNQNQIKREAKEMDEQFVKDAIQAALKEREEAERKAKEAAEIEALKAENASLKAAAAADRRVPLGAPAVTSFADTGKYDGMDAADLAVAIGVQQAAKKINRGDGASQSAVKALAIKVAEENSDAAEDGRKYLKAHGINPDDALNATKANELNYSTQVSYGDEFAGVVYSNQLWSAIRSSTFVMQKLDQFAYRRDIPRGAESVVIPIEGSDPTWYVVSQSTAVDGTMGIPVASVTASKAGTANKPMGVKKLGARALYSGELDEDSVIPWASYIRTKLEVSGAEQIESAVIDGDTDNTAATNINAVGAAQTLAAGDIRLAFDGLRKLPLITNTGNMRSAGGSIAESDFIETLKLLGTAGLNGADSRVTEFIVDPNVNWKIMQLTAVKTKDVFTQATLENGFLKGIWGYRVNVSNFMHMLQSARKVNSAGKIDKLTDGNNTLGAFLAVRWDQWAFGYGRNITIEVVRRPESDSYDVVALLRMGLTYRDNEASAISYNVLV